jgi:hypothetical protein
MPLVRYFFFVGGALFALLLIADAVLPKLPVPDRDETGIDLPVVRINSDRKWPERVVFDTSTPAIAPATVSPPPATTQASVPAPATVADIPASARVRGAFAQFEPAYPTRSGPKPQAKRKIAKNRISPPVVMVAQQPRPGFFASSTW